MKADSYCAKTSLLKWILLLVGGFFLFMILYGICQGMAEFLPDMGDVTLMVLIAAGLFLLLAYAGHIKLFERRKVYELAPSKAASGLLAGLGVGLAYFCILVALLWAIGSYRVISFNAPTMEVLEYFCVFFIVAVGEEIIFRGIVFRMVDERYSTWVAYLVSALLFGFVHIINPGATVWSSVAIAIEAGLMLGAAYKYSGGLWMPIGIHWAWNFTQGNVFGFEVSGNEVTASLITPEVSGAEIITGGAFGPEASILAAAFGLAITLLFVRFTDHGTSA